MRHAHSVFHILIFCDGDSIFLLEKKNLNDKINFLSGGYWASIWGGKSKRRVALALSAFVSDLLHLSSLIKPIQKEWEEATAPWCCVYHILHLSPSFSDEPENHCLQVHLHHSFSNLGIRKKQPGETQCQSFSVSTLDFPPYSEV